MALSGGLNAVVALVVVVCGAVYSLLVALLYRRVALVFTSHSHLAIYTDNYNAPYWIAGFSFIVPGIVAGIAAFYKMKTGYIVQILFCFAGLVTMGALYLGALPPISAYTLFNFNTCSNLSPPDPTLDTRACEDLTSIAGFGVGAGVMAVLGWVFCLLSLVIALWYICSMQSKDKLDINQHLMYMEKETPRTEVYAIQSPRYYEYAGYATPTYYGHERYAMKFPRYVPASVYAKSPRYVHQPRYITQPGYSREFVFRPAN